MVFTLLLKQVPRNKGKALTPPNSIGITPWKQKERYALNYKLLQQKS